MTDDVDITLLTGPLAKKGRSSGRVAHVAQAALKRPDAKEFAERSRVLLPQTDTGVGIDIAMGAFPFEELATQRARDITLYPGVNLRLCTAEDFVVFKVFAAREQDWRDVEMTIVRQGDAALDWKYIREQLVPLLELKEQPDLLDQLEALRARLLRNP